MYQGVRGVLLLTVEKPQNLGTEVWLEQGPGSGEGAAEQEMQVSTRGKGLPCPAWESSSARQEDETTDSKQLRRRPDQQDLAAHRI